MDNPSLRLSKDPSYFLCVCSYFLIHPFKHLTDGQDFFFIISNTLLNWTYALSRPRNEIYCASVGENCLWGFPPSKTQIKQLRYRELAETGGSQRLYHVEAHQKWRINRYLAFQIANNKGTDQTAQMPRLVCSFDVRKQQSQGFSH